MRMRTALIGALVAVTLVVGFFAAVPVRAAPFAPVVPAQVTEAGKVVLNETSVNAPGFSGNTQLGSAEVIAWAGTDAAHHLNVMTSADGLHYGHKITLGELSINRPAVVQMSQVAGGAVALAWLGTDPAHRLNVLFDVYGARKKLTLNETSFSGPALTIFKGDLLLSWTGTNAGHSLNVLRISLSSLTPTTKTVLPQFSSNAGPTLTTIVKAAIETAVLGWSTPSSGLNLIQSVDGVHFTSALVGGLSETSASAPAEISFQTEGGPGDWIAWTGTDPSHHLNVKWTAHYLQWTGAKTVLPELALGGPGLAFNQGLLIAWTGTDSAHHLNVARLQGF